MPRRDFFHGTGRLHATTSRPHVDSIDESSRSTVTPKCIVRDTPVARCRISGHRRRSIQATDADNIWCICPELTLTFLFLCFLQSFHLIPQLDNQSFGCHECCYRNIYIYTKCFKALISFDSEVLKLLQPHHLLLPTTYLHQDAMKSSKSSKPIWSYRVAESSMVCILLCCMLSPRCFPASFNQ